jgi:DNA (cytosine-5)-methyltransferase 1
VFPEATHGPGLTPFETAADCIDFSDLGESIFGRERELAEATKRRIARGTVRHVINNPNPFIVTMRGTESSHIDSSARSINEPIRTISANGQHHALVTPFGIPVSHSGDARTYSIEEPMRTIQASCRGNMALVSAFLVQHQGGFYDRKQCVAPPITGPMPTVMSKGCTTQLVTALTGEDREKAHRVAAFIISYYGSDQNPRINWPAPTVTSKDRFSLVTVHGDPITDIRMRMFKPRELFRANSFSNDYIIDRGITEDGEEFELTKTEQVRMCGNSVPPKMAEVLVRANVIDQQRERAA